MITVGNRLRRHGDYRRVYNSSRKRFSKQMSFFFLLRDSIPSGQRTSLESLSGPRIGLTVPRALGKAVERNRIKRRVREAVRRQIGTLQAPVDVILHPSRKVSTTDFGSLERDVLYVLATVQREAERQLRNAAAVGGVE